MKLHEENIARLLLGFKTPLQPRRNLKINILFSSKLLSNCIIIMVYWAFPPKLHRQSYEFRTLFFATIPSAANNFINNTKLCIWILSIFRFCLLLNFLPFSPSHAVVRFNEMLLVCPKTCFLGTNAMTMPTQTTATIICKLKINHWTNYAINHQTFSFAARTSFRS